MTAPCIRKRVKQNRMVITELEDYRYFNLSLVMRKLVYGVCDQVRLKPACSATEASYRLEILDIETRDIRLSRQ